MPRTRADHSVVLLSRAEAVVAGWATKVIVLRTIAQTHSPVTLIPTLPPDPPVALLELTWCPLAGCPLAKDTEVTPEDLPLLPVVEWPTNIHLNKATNSKVTNNKATNNPVAITISITKAVNTTTGISKAATARRIIVEAEAVAVIVAEEAVETIKARVEVEVDMVVTK